MFFTREDILKIQQALLQFGVKDSELPNAKSVTYDDILSIVQDGKNKQIGVKDFCNQTSLLKRKDFINITDKYDEHYISLTEAITLVPILQRKDGLVITFQDVEGNWEIYQFRGNITEFFEEDKWFNLSDCGNNIIQSIVPDEEDLTASTPDENKKSLVSLKDRIYDPTSFSGKGYKILRKNIQSINIAVTKIKVESTPSSDGVLSFSINGKETQVSVSVSTDNTTILVADKIVSKLTETMTEYEVSKDSSTIILTRKFGGSVTPSLFSASTTGVVCTVADSTKTELQNILTPIMINQPNTTYEIRYDFNLNGETIEMQEGCTLKFEGGMLKNGTITFNDTKIINNLFTHIDPSLSYNVKFKNDKSEICVDDFGADPNCIKLSTEAINKAIQYCSYNKIARPIQFYGKYLIDDAIMLESNITLSGNNSELYWNKLKGTKVFGTDIFNKDGYKNITIKGFKVDCDNAWTYIYEDGKDKSLPRGVFALSNIDGLKILDCKRTYPSSIQPVWLYDCSNVIIEDCRFIRTLTAEQDQSESNGIWVSNGNKAIENIEIRNCYIKGYRDGCIEVYMMRGRMDDWSTTDFSPMKNVNIHDNHLIGGSYAITMGIAGLNDDGSLKSYIENTIVSNNIIEDSSIVYRINCKGNHTVKNNTFIYNTYSSSPIFAINFEHYEESGLGTVLISGNQGYGECLNGVMNIGKCNKLIVCDNTFNFRYSASNSAVELRGPMALGAYFTNNYFKGNTVFNLKNSIAKTQIRLINNCLIGYQCISLQDTGNPYILKLFNNYIDGSVVVTKSSSTNIDTSSVFSNNLIGAGFENTWNTPIFSIKGAGVNQVITGSGSSYMTNGNKPDKVYEGYGSTIANQNGYGGFVLGTSQNLPMIINKGAALTLRGTNLPSEGLGTKVKMLGNIESAPTDVLNEENKGYIYYDTNKKCTIEWDGSKWIPVDNKTGTTEERPTFNTTEAPIYKGMQYYDRTLNKPIWWNGSSWVDKDGNPADAKKQGTAEQRPSSVQIGYIYKDTTLGQLILWNGTAWVILYGTPIS